MSIYQAIYVCKRLEPSGMSGYHTVRLGLGLPGDNRSSDVVIYNTCSGF